MRTLEGIDIQPEQRVWRYLKVHRFEELMGESYLYFAAATEFEDKFEGAVAVQPHDFPVDPRYPELDSCEHAFRELKRLTKLCCWHIADYESDAMWKIYSGSSKGVAITSTPSRIAAALAPYRLKEEYGAEDFWAGNVRYIDLMT